MLVKSVKIGDMLVYPVTSNLVDVFWGDGWENQARFKFTQQGIDRIPKRDAVGHAIKTTHTTLPRGVYSTLKQWKGVK